MNPESTVRTLRKKKVVQESESSTSEDEVLPSRRQAEKVLAAAPTFLESDLALEPPVVPASTTPTEDIGNSITIAGSSMNVVNTFLEYESAEGPRTIEIFPENPQFQASASLHPDAATFGNLLV